MVKIYFAPAWGLSNEEMTNWYKRQTPNNSGVWNELESTYDIDESDYIVMQDVTSENIDKSKTIFLGKEPNYISKHRCGDCFRELHHELGNSWMPQTWWVNMPYNELKNLTPNKTKKLSVVNSNKRGTKGQSIRYDIIQRIIRKYPNDIDVWGGITMGRKNIGPFKDMLPPRDKKAGLLPYKYHFACENGDTPFYFTEKIIDPLICWSMPIYWGCKNIDKFLPEGSYVNIDVDDPSAVDKIIEISSSDLWENSLDKISEARELIMNKYNLWATIELGIKNENIINL